jgi:hypothetical protein
MKYLLPPAWGLAYQQVGRFGLLIVILLLSFGARFFTIWLAPVYYLVNVAERIVLPFILISPWTTT